MRLLTIGTVMNAPAVRSSTAKTEINIFMGKPELALESQAERLVRGADAAEGLELIPVVGVSLSNLLVITNCAWFSRDIK